MLWLLLALGLSPRCFHARFFGICSHWALSPGAWMYLLSLCMYYSIHLVYFFSLIALTLLTPRESSLLQRELLELPAQVRPRIALFFYCITSHYLFSQMFRSLGTETVATLFPGIISVANTLHSAWHIWVGLLCCRKEQKNECERQVSEQWGRKQGHRS